MINNTFQINLFAYLIFISEKGVSAWPQPCLVPGMPPQERMTAPTGQGWEPVAGDLAERWATGEVGPHRSWGFKQSPVRAPLSHQAYIQDTHFNRATTECYQRSVAYCVLVTRVWSQLEKNSTYVQCLECSKDDEMSVLILTFTSCST